MANTYYSNLYELSPFRGALSYNPRANNVRERGGIAAVEFTFTIPTTIVLGIGDIIKLVPALNPGGTKVRRYTAKYPGYDGGAALVYNLGWMSQANGAGLITGSTSARGAAVESLTDTQMLNQTASGGAVTVVTNNQQPGTYDELVIFVTTAAASAGTNGLTTGYLELEYQ